MKNFFFLLFYVSCLVLSAQQTVKPIAEKSILFFGDSISRGGYYITVIQLFEALRHPERPVRVINGGISGDTAKGALKRLEHDIYPQKPERVLIMFGMNDVGRHLYKTAVPDEKTAERRKEYLERYRKNMTELTDKLLAKGIKVDLILPTPFDQYGSLAVKNLPSCNDGLAECASILRSIAGEKNLAVIDLHSPMTALLKKYPEKHLCGPDRVHPGIEGHFIMGTMLLNALKESPFVAETVINAKTNSVSVRNAEISGLKNENGILRFTYAPKSLPYPIADYYTRVDRVIFPVTELLNKEILTVSGLPAGKYSIKADNQKIAEVTADELSKGINLALLKTPSQRIANAALQVSWKIHRTVHAIRGIKQADIIIMNNKGNPADLKNAVETLEKWIEPRKDNYWLSVLKTYKADKPKENEYKRELDKLFEELYRTVKPKAFEISIHHLPATALQ